VSGTRSRPALPATRAGGGRRRRPGAGGLAEGDRVACLGGAAFAEAELADAGSCVKPPPALDGRPFPGEPLPCAVNVFRRSGIERGMAVAIVGVGASRSTSPASWCASADRS
jgi:hypothetical protein